MKVFDFRKEQSLPLDIHTAWKFFSNPANLAAITPAEMAFRITSAFLPEKMYAGQIITYRVKPISGISVSWVTEITQVNEPHFFVDEQRSGPYSLWHHQHHFKEIEGGVLMTDIVHYALPFGFAGLIAGGLLVKKQLQKIFNYREQKLITLFGNMK